MWIFSQANQRWRLYRHRQHQILRDKWERLWLLKTDSSGNKEWDRTFGGFVSSSGDGGWSVDETDDGYIVTGYTRSYGAGGKDLWLIKTDSLGVEQWHFPPAND